MNTVIFHLLIQIGYFPVGKIIAGMWEVIPENLFSAILYNSRPLDLLFIKSQKNIKFLELDKFGDRLDAALSNLILVRGVLAPVQGG